MQNTDTPTPEERAAALPRQGTPPMMLTAAWVEKASPTEIDLAYGRGLLHAYLGGQVDAEGYPIGPDGKRLDFPNTGK